VSRSFELLITQAALVIMSQPASATPLSHPVSVLQVEPQKELHIAFGLDAPNILQVWLLDPTMELHLVG
jgi:hypothetical protein